ncbi:twin-arginine translocation signal domain-containing protein [Streptomyces inhibens]|uniref:twin-arginine translocation signal domain-containing protein n=1 Tax=Streptomyces inhibens TaxID=2293571 RepID=UPI00402AF8BC
MDRRQFLTASAAVGLAALALPDAEAVTRRANRPALGLCDSYAPISTPNTPTAQGRMADQNTTAMRGAGVGTRSPAGVPGPEKGICGAGMLGLLRHLPPSPTW